MSCHSCNTFFRTLHKHDTFHCLHNYALLCEKDHAFLCVENKSLTEEKHIVIITLSHPAHSNYQSDCNEHEVTLPIPSINLTITSTKSDTNKHSQSIVLTETNTKSPCRYKMSHDTLMVIK